MQRGTYLELPQGTLELLILRVLEPEARHGWAIAQRLEQVSSAALRVKQGSLYPALHRMEREKLLRSRWAESDNNRRAKYYELTRKGRLKLEASEAQWKRLVAVVGEVMGRA
ncbi:MAG: PadR family transcriptional regulator [Terriglobales bacterium]